MPLVKTPAITLKSRKWGDADRIVTFYAKHLGKIRAVARGARRPKSRLGAALEPLTLCDLNLFEKSGDALYRVSQVDLVEPFLRFREDLTLMAAAARMANVVAAVTPDGDPDPPLFETLEQGLRLLVTNSDPALTALLFQIRLLGLTGLVRKPTIVRPVERPESSKSRSFRRHPAGLYARAAQPVSASRACPCHAAASRFFNRRCAWRRRW